MNKRAVSQLIALLLIFVLACLTVYFIWNITSEVIEKELEASKTRNKLTEARFGIDKIRDFGYYMNITLKNLEKKLSLANETVETKVIEIPLKTDVISVVDLSGSMESCNNEDEIQLSYHIWEDSNGEIFCGERSAFDFRTGQTLTNQNNQYCYPQKINLAKEAQKDFIEEALKNENTKIGIVEYSSDYKIEQLNEPDLTTTFYIGSEIECFDKDIFEIDYDYSSWESAESSHRENSQADCINCRTFFRRDFRIDNLKEVNYLVVYKSTEYDHVCFINGKEVAENNKNLNYPEKIPKKYLQEGENTIVCSIQKDSGIYHRFFLELITNKGFITPTDKPIKKIEANQEERVLHYSFDDYNQTIQDSSSKNNFGEIIGNGVHWHQVDKSIFFEGDSYIEIKNENFSGDLHKDLTIEFWINPRFLGEKRENPIHKDYQGEFSLTLEYATTKGRMHYFHGTGTNYYAFEAFPTGTIKNNEWQHIVLTRDTSTRTLKSYLNGELIKEGNYPSNRQPSKSSNPLQIGAGYTMDASNGYGFRGRLDEIVIYDKALTEEEILDNYEKANPGIEQWKKKTFLQCGVSKNPKYIHARKNIATNFSLIATIRNTGPAITEPFDLTFYEDSLSGPVIEKIQIEEIGALEIKKIKTDWTGTLSDDKTIYTKVDSEEVITESSETNNHASIKINTYEFIKNDLIVTDIILEEICLWEPRNYKIKANIKNIGANAISENFEVSFYNSSEGNLIGTTTITGGLQKDETKQAEIEWFADLTSETEIIAFADSEEIIEEGNEDNNNRTATIVKRLPYIWSYTLNLNNDLCEENQEVNFQATASNYIYYCKTENDIKHVLTMQEGNFSDYDILYAPYGHGSGTAGNFKTIRNFNFITPSIGEKVKFYVYLDPENSQEKYRPEMSNKTYEITIGTDIYASQYSPEFYVDGKKVDEISINTPTDVTITHKSRLIKCGPVTFNMSFYHTSVSPENYIGSVEQTLTGTSYSTSEFLWENVIISEDTRIYAVADPNNEIIEYNEANNQRSAILKAVEPTPQSIFPNIFKLKLNPWILGILGLRHSAYPFGEEIKIYSEGIVNIHALSTSVESLKEFIDKEETWWDTCICCGIEKGIEMLEYSVVHNKLIILMSDGEATQACETGNPKEDAIKSAKKAYEKGITVHSVCFGKDCDEDTMKEIAEEGNGTYFKATDAGSLNKVYSNLSVQINTAVNKEYRPKYGIDHLKFIFYNKTKMYIYETSDLPTPLNTKTISIPPIDSPEYPLNKSITNVDKIEIYAVMIDSYGREYASAILDVYEF